MNLSSDSSGWLLSCLDPYHDYQYSVEGLPDERTAPSVVQIHNQSLTVTAPAAAAGGNFDVNIVYTGLDCATTNLPRSNNQLSGSVHAYQSNALLTPPQVGSLVIWAGAAGSTWSTGFLNGGEVQTALGSFVGTDRGRLIGVAFEVHNTTAEIYKQGSLTVAQLSDSVCDAGTCLYIDGASSVQSLAVQADHLPVRASTLGPLLSVPGSCTWPAADGVYAVPRMVNVPREVHRMGSSANRVPIIYGTDGLLASTEPTGFAQNVPIFPAAIPSGFTPVQVAMTGLSPQTTLTVTFRTIVEYFPALGSPLMPLADPSPVYDPLVFGAYSAIIRDAPFAVPVGQNAAGDYFRKILKVAGNAMDLTSPMFGQYAPLVALAAKGAKMLSTLGVKKPTAKVEKRGAGAPARQVKR